MAFPEPFYRWRPHPWHGLDTGERSPEVVNAYIEITPFDTVKYELDKETGYLRVDRPQRGTSAPPTLYGLIPRTYCGQRVGALTDAAARGDGDPLDICVVSERQISRAEVLLNARVVGGIQMIDGGEADDKIVAVLEKDNLWADVMDIDELPPILVERLRHYFGTYKLVPGIESPVTIAETYGREHAFRVIEASITDYQEMFGE
jgi:inorganic pyrophosphatase